MLVSIKVIMFYLINFVLIIVLDRKCLVLPKADNYTIKLCDGVEAAI